MKEEIRITPVAKIDTNKEDEKSITWLERDGSQKRGTLVMDGNFIKTPENNDSNLGSADTNSIDNDEIDPILINSFFVLGGMDKNDPSYLEQETFFINNLKKSDPNNYKNLIESIFSDKKENFEEEFSEDSIKEIFSKYFDLLKNSNKNISIDLYDEKFIKILVESFYKTRDEKKKGEDSFNEKIYKIVTSLAHQYPEEIRQSKFWRYFSQRQGDSCRISVIFDSLIDLVKDPKCRIFASDINSEDLEYIYANGDKEILMTEIQKRLDFNDEKKFGGTAAMLESFKLFSIQQNYEGENNVGIIIQEAIKKSLKSPGSYLLRNRAEEILEIFKNKDLEFNNNPFKISKDNYAFWDDEGLKLINKETYDNKIRKIEEFKEFKESDDSVGWEAHTKYEYFNNEIWGIGGRSIEQRDVLFKDEEIKNNYDLLFDFEFLQRSNQREKIEKDFNISLEQLTLKEQFQFLNHLKSKENEDFKRIESCCKRFGTPFARTFLSIEQGGKEMGGKILVLGEKLPKESADILFKTYGEIINTTNSIEQILKEILPEYIVEESSDEILDIRKSLFVRAKDLLVTFYDKKDKNDVDLINDLDRYKAEILLYADTYKKLKESGKEITLEDIKNTQITILSQEEKEKMSKNFWNITKANRPFIIEGSQEMKEREKNFNLTIGNKNSDFYVLKYKDNVISFCSFTPDEDGNLYIESLNTESEAKGSHIGSEFLPSVLEKVKNSRKDIYGHVHTHNSGTLPYYERLGFDVKQVEENGELKYYEIRIKAQQKQEQSSMAA
jgi:hypothetical protein